MASASAPDLQSAAEGSNSSEAQDRQPPFPSPKPRPLSSPPLRDEMTIPVSVPQKELLKNNDAAEEFLNKLQECNIDIEIDSLHTDRIVVVKGDPLKAKECFASVICSESVNFIPADETETISSLNELRERFTAQFALEVSQGGRVEVAFLAAIKQEVSLVLKELKYRKKSVPLTRYLYKHLQSNLQNFVTKFNSTMHPPVDLRLVIGPSNQPHLQLSCQRTQLPKAEEALEKRMTLFCYRQLEVDRSRGSYLQSSAGKASIQDIENNHHCTMNIQTQDKRMLLMIRSDQGHEVEICEGNMAASECPILLLPVWHDQTEWKPPYDCILQRGGLNTNPSYYLSRVGLPPKPLISVRPCHDVDQTVIVMYIPPRSHDQFQDKVLTAMTEALKEASAAGSGIAIPLKLCADIDFEVISLLLTAVCNCYDDDDLSPTVQFYLDPGASWSGDIASFFHKFQRRGWTTEDCTDMEGGIFDQRVKVVIGDILNTEGDAVVNSTDYKLTHAYGQVSKVFLRHLGKPLTDQCEERYKGGIGHHIVAITDAFDFMQFKSIFHVALPTDSWRAQDAKRLLQELRTRVEACLCLASIKGFSSIIIPALATGTLSYPPHLEARTVLEATREFFSNMPHSPLKKVIIIAYRKNPTVAKVVKAEENFQRYSLHQFADRGKVERRFEWKDVTVQVIKGDALKRRCTAELLLCASPPTRGTMEDYQKKKEPECTMQIVHKSLVTNTIRDVLKNTTAASVQINMQTFDAEHIDGIISGIDKSSARNLQIILIVVPTSDLFRRLCHKLAQTRTFTADQGTQAGPADKSYACVSIYGSVKDTKEAASKVLAIPVPEEYIEGEKYSLHHSFVERARYSHVSTVVAAGRASQASGRRASARSSMVTPRTTTGGPTQSQQDPDAFTIPRQQLKDLGVSISDLMDVMDNTQIAVILGGGTATFRRNAGAAGVGDIRTYIKTTVAGLAQRRAPLPAPTAITEEQSGQGAAAPLPGATCDQVPRGAEDLFDSALIQSLGSFHIPPRISMQSTTSSKTFDKNVSQEDSEARDGGRTDAQPSADDGLGHVGRDGDAGDGSSLQPQSPSQSPQGQ